MSAGTATILPMVGDGTIRSGHLRTGELFLQRLLAIDLGVDLGLGSGRYPGVELSERGTTLLLIPRGFVFDGSSVPRLARPIITAPEALYAGGGHDFAYRVGVPLLIAHHIWWIIARSPALPEEPDPKPKRFSRAWWVRGYRKAVGRNGRLHLGPIRSAFGWTGLVLGGWVAYQPTRDPLVHKDGLVARFDSWDNRDAA